MSDADELAYLRVELREALAEIQRLRNALQERCECGKKCGQGER